MLSEDDLDALPEGTPITVIWSGGNGPHGYLLHNCGEYGLYAAPVDGNENLKHYNPLTFVGTERFLTRVWAAAPPDAKETR